MSRIFSRGVRLLLGAAVLVLCGCGGPGQVSGVVRYKGKALTSGNVIFLDQGNRPTPPAAIQTDGSFFAPAVPVGPATIVIDAYPPPLPENRDPNSPEYREYQLKAATFVPIPARYMDLRDSGQRLDVKPGGNVCDLDLD